MSLLTLSFAPMSLRITVSSHYNWNSSNFHKRKDLYRLMNIRRLETPEDYEACEKTMKEVWKFTDRDIIPAHILKPINDQGGLVLGAFEHGEMIGILVGFLAFYKGILHHHSHVTGVVQRYKGVGYQLKQKQREFALSQGLNLVTWTFDPLQSSNAYFNFAKLGVISNTYYKDYYGEMSDLINVGLASDRFLVEWWITSEDVVNRVEGAFEQPALEKMLSQADVVNKTERMQEFRKNVSFDLRLNSKNILAEIPVNLNAMKDKSMGLAREWRKITREIFETYFSRGYTACNVLSEIAEGERRTFYLLRRDAHENPKN